MSGKHSDFESIVGILLLCAALFLFFNLKIFIYILLAVGFITATSDYIRVFASKYWMKLWMSVGKIVSVIPLGLIFIYLTFVGIFRRFFTSKARKQTSNFKDSSQLCGEKYFNKTW